MGDRINIASRIRAARRAQDLNQSDLAKLVNLAQSQVSNIERGKYAIDAERIPEFSQALGVDISYFYQSETTDPNQIFRID